MNVDNADTIQNETHSDTKTRAGGLRSKSFVGTPSAVQCCVIPLMIVFDQ